MNESMINIGETLYALRVYKGLEISELAQDICSDEDLVLFEKNKKVPSINQLYQLASKLNLKLSDFFDFTAVGSVNYVSAVVDLINKYKRERNYYAINKIVQREKENPLFKSPSNQQFLLWHEAVCLYYLSESEDRDKNYCIKMLNDAIELTNPSKKGLTEREIEIKMAIALIEKDDKNFQLAINILKEVLLAMDNLPGLTEPRIKLRALFGLSQSLSRINNYDESLIYSKKGVLQCINDEVLYLLGEFLYQTGLNYINLKDHVKGKEYFTKSLQIFDLQKNHILGNIVREELTKITSQ